MSPVSIGNPVLPPSAVPSFTPPVSVNPVIPPLPYAPPGMTPPSYPGGLPYATVPALPGAAERAAAALGTFKRPPAIPALGLGRLLPYGLIALPLVIPALLEPFAPGVQDWLRRGWKLPGYGVPDSLQPGQVVPGSRATWYYVYTTGKVNAGNCSEATQAEGYAGLHIGPITRAETAQGTAPIGCPTDPQQQIQVSILKSGGVGIASATRYMPAAIGDLNFRTVPLDGQAEGVPNPNLPPVATPYAPVQNPKQGEPLYNPNPARERDPAPLLPPVLPGSKPAPFPNRPTATPTPAPLLPPATSPNPGAAPAPSPGAQAQGSPPGIVPPPASAPPAPPQRPLSPSEECSDPCALRNARGIDAIKEKLEELLKEEPPQECPPPPFIPNILFPIATGSCDAGTPKIKMWELRLREAPPEGLREALDEMLGLAAAACQTDNVVAFPDWWQVRIGADRPQIVIAYRSGNTSAYHSLSIPWPASNAKWTSNLLGDYQAGAVHGVLNLKDNSKFIVNCVSEAEARRMIAKARTLINPAMLDSNPIVHISKKEGRVVIERQRFGRNASYYPTGQLEFAPAWKAVFRD